MSRAEIRKLLGGYATDTLSGAERSALFEAALEDQELFDALAKEQALRDVLQDPSARQQLIVALGAAHTPLRWWRRPAALALAGGVAALLMVAGLVLRQTRHAARTETMVADAITQPPAAAVSSSAAPIEKTEPAVVSRHMKRRAPLPAARALPAPQAVASPAPSPPPSQSQMVEVAAGQDVTSQNQPSATALPRAKMAARVAANAGVAYIPLLKNAAGAYSPVPSNTVFHAGDSVRLQVKPSEAGYVHLFQRPGATAGWTLISSRPVEKNQLYELPATGGIESDVPARLELWLVLSRLEYLDVEALASRAQAAATVTIEFR